MKIDFDVITLRGCLMCFWQYKMDRNRGWCWIEDTVVSWTLSQTENARIKTHAIKILSRRMSLRKNGDYNILMLKPAKDAKSFHYILFTKISDICSTGGRSPKLIRWEHPLTLTKRVVPKYRWTRVKRGAMVFGTVQNNEDFILFTLITLGSWVVSHYFPFWNQNFTPYFRISDKVSFFKQNACC